MHTGRSVAVNPSQQEKVKCRKGWLWSRAAGVLSCGGTRARPAPGGSGQVARRPSAVVRAKAAAGARGGAACFPFSSGTRGTTVNVLIHNLNRPGLKLTLSSFGVQYIIS